MHCAVARAARLGLLELDFDEPELVGIDVDDVVADARGTVVGDTGRELRIARAVGFDQTQRAARQRHDHVVEGVHMLAGCSARREAPQRHEYARIIDLDRRHGFHARHHAEGTLSSRKRCRNSFRRCRRWRISMVAAVSYWLANSWMSRKSPKART